MLEFFTIWRSIPTEHFLQTELVSLELMNQDLYLLHYYEKIILLSPLYPLLFNNSFSYKIIKCSLFYLSNYINVNIIINVRCSSKLDLILITNRTLFYKDKVIFSYYIFIVNNNKVII